ncbi:hypothetical protein WJX72_003906 [[Myrmecia] bisecta]|uniref:Radical SAM core domain-containing protein n=1 Tax=[Myrmecia] bisecta TaxID=41462 RepID=A0AAW1P1Q4_9CHLO
MYGGHRQADLDSRVQAFPAALDAATTSLQPGPTAAADKQASHTAGGAAASTSGRENLPQAQGCAVLKNMTLPQLEEWCLSLGERPQRAHQLWRWMYYDGNWIRRIDDACGVPNGFSNAFRETANELATVDGGLELLYVQKAGDGTRKMVFKLTSGEGAGSTVEAVVIPIVRGSGTKPRTTLCVSSQVGCAMNCQFCFTGRMGFRANLSAAQIVEQVVEARRLLAAEAATESAKQADQTAGKGSPARPDPITNIVFMGMGEPFQNLDAVLRAVDIMCSPSGLHLSHNKISVSTVGLVPEIRRFCESSRAQLAVSLHATTNQVRDWIAPVNRRWPLETLVATLEEYFPRHAASSPHGRHVLIEYVMLRGVNDTLEDAHRLLKLLANVECKINLIVFNPHQGTRFRASELDQVTAFRSIVIQGGRVCTVRDSRGDDEMAACGQLGALAGSPHAPPILEPPERFKAALAPVA